MTSTQLAYRQAAVAGASGFGLLIALYNSLIADLRRAADAQQNGHIERRTDEVNHALLLIGFMENWIDREDGGGLATWLLSFYADLRSSLIVAQARQSVPMLQHHIPQLLHLRGIWQDMERGTIGLVQRPAAMAHPAAVNAVQSSGMASSWTI